MIYIENNPKCKWKKALKRTYKLTNINKKRIEGIKDNKKFSPKILNEIYNHNTGEIFLLSDNFLQDNFIIKVENSIDPKIDKKSEDYKTYSKKSNARYISRVYKSYDKYINANYKIDINQKVLERLKNSF